MAKPALRPRLTQKQIRFIREYAIHGNGAEAVRRAGYSTRSPDVVKQQASENLAKPYVKSAIKQEVERLGLNITPARVQRRLDEISHASQEAGQFGPAVRAEELLGKSIGMWIDQSLNVTANISGDHLQALLEVARKRQQEPIDLGNNDARIRNADRKGEP